MPTIDARVWDSPKFRVVEVLKLEDLSFLEKTALDQAVDRLLEWHVPRCAEADVGVEILRKGLLELLVLLEQGVKGAHVVKLSLR